MAPEMRISRLLLFKGVSAKSRGDFFFNVRKDADKPDKPLESGSLNSVIALDNQSKIAHSVCVGREGKVAAGRSA